MINIWTVLAIITGVAAIIISRFLNKPTEKVMDDYYEKIKRRDNVKEWFDISYVVKSSYKEYSNLISNDMIESAKKVIEETVGIPFSKLKDSDTLAGKLDEAGIDTISQKYCELHNDAPRLTCGDFDLIDWNVSEICIELIVRHCELILKKQK